MSERITLFYVDDDADDLDFFKEVTDGMDVKAFFFNKGEEMLKQIKNPPPEPSVVFLDLNMPYKTGYEIIEELKESAYANIPLVVFSTAGDHTVVQQCQKLGASLYIKKVSSCKELKKAIEFTLDIDWTNFNPDGSNFLYKK